MTRTRRPVKWTTVRNEENGRASQAFPWVSIRTREPHRTEGDDDPKYTHRSTTENRQEAKSHTGESSKAVRNFTADFVHSVSFVGPQSAAQAEKRTVNATSSAPLPEETLASKIKEPENENVKGAFSITTVASHKNTTGADVIVRHESGVPDGAATVVPRLSTRNTRLSGEGIPAVTSEKADRGEAQDSITEGASTRYSHLQEIAREENRTENLESVTRIVHSNSQNYLAATLSNAKLVDIVNTTDTVTQGTDSTSAGLQLSTTDALSQLSGHVFSDRLESTTVELEKSADMPSTTALPSTEYLTIQTTPSQVPQMFSAKAHLKDIEAAENTLTTVAVTKESISNDDSQVTETELSLPFFTFPLPLTAMPTPAPKMTAESDSNTFLNTLKKEPTAGKTEFTHATTASPAKMRVTAPDESYAKTTVNEERASLFSYLSSEIRMSPSKGQATKVGVSFETVTGASLLSTRQMQSVYYPYPISSITDTPTPAKAQEARATKGTQGLPASTDLVKTGPKRSGYKSTNVTNAVTTLEDATETTTFATTIMNAPTHLPKEASHCRQRHCVSTTGIGALSSFPPEGMPPKVDAEDTMPPGTNDIGKDSSMDTDAVEKSEVVEQRGTEFEENSAPVSTSFSKEDRTNYLNSLVPTGSGTSSAMSTEANLDATGVTGEHTQENSNPSVFTYSAPNMTIVAADKPTSPIILPIGTEIFWNETEVAVSYNAAPTVMPTFIGAQLPTTLVQNVAADLNQKSTTNAGPASTKVMSANDAPAVSLAMSVTKPSESFGISSKSTLAVLTTTHGFFNQPINTKDIGEKDRHLLTALNLPTTVKEKQQLHTVDLGRTTAHSGNPNFPSTDTDNSYTEGTPSLSTEAPSTTALSSTGDSWKTFAPSERSPKNAEKAVLSRSTTSLQFEKDELIQGNVEAQELGTTEQGSVAPTTRTSFPAYQSHSSTIGLALTVPALKKEAALEDFNPPSITELPLAITAAESIVHFPTASSPIESESLFSTQNTKTTTMKTGVSDSDVVTTEKGQQSHVEELSERLTEELHLSKAIWRSKNMKPSITMYLTTHLPRIPNSNTPHTTDHTYNDGSEVDAGTQTTPALGDARAAEPTSETAELNLTPSEFPLETPTETQAPSPLVTVSYTDESARHEDVSTSKSPEFSLNGSREAAQITIAEIEANNKTKLEEIRRMSVAETSTGPTLLSGQTSHASSTEKIYGPSTRDEIVLTQNHDAEKRIFTSTMATSLEQYETSSSSGTTNTVISSPDTPETVAPITSTTTTPYTLKQETTTKAPVCKASFGLFRHPTDCNLFVHCSYSKPFVKKCPANLHFNEEIMVCDYPYRAGCLTKRT